MEIKENTLEYYNLIFKDFPDVVNVKQLKQMIPDTGNNKIYKLLKLEKYIQKE